MKIPDDERQRDKDSSDVRRESGMMGYSDMGCNTQKEHIDKCGGI